MPRDGEWGKREERGRDCQMMAGKTHNYTRLLTNNSQLTPTYNTSLGLKKKKKRETKEKKMRTSFHMRILLYLTRIIKK